MKKRLAIFIAFLCAVSVANAQDNLSALMPMPNHVEQAKGKPYRLVEGRTAIAVADEGQRPVAETLAEVIEHRTGIVVPVVGGGAKASVTMTVDPTMEGEEHYRIAVSDKGIGLVGSTVTALYRAVMTMDQLLLGDVLATARDEIAPVYIDDAPRFERRALMLDPARHFLPVKDVKFYIDQMAKYKYNVLQLHLTDDQGWRVAIDSHPKLASKQHYTQDELRDIIAYAAERHIEVVPEVDIPGHTVAILAAYPELGCSHLKTDTVVVGKTTNRMVCAANEKCYEVLADVVEELAALFPSPYIHLGGDEAAVPANWAKCADCQAMMHEAGYTKATQLMIPFFNRILESVREAGKRPILWCELDNIYPPANDYLFPYPEDVTLVTWRNGLTPTCLSLTRKYGHPIIMAPGEHAYFDYPQWRGDLPEFNNWGMPVLSLERSYKLDPGYGRPAEEQSHVLGVMGTLWAEAIPDINRATYMTYPRAFALAEAGWTEMENRSWESFVERMYPNLTDLMKCGVSVRVPFEIVERNHAVANPEARQEVLSIQGVASYTPKNPNTLWYTTSAKAAGVGYPWMEYALPLGNGELGCMVFGGVAREELQFNEKTLWSGPADVVGAPSGSRTFMNFGSLIITDRDAGIWTEGVTDYVRYLDIEEGIAGVEFKNANGTKQTRKYLSSAPDQVIAGQYKSKGKDKLNLVFTLEPGNDINASEVVYENGTASFTGAMTVKYAARLHVVADKHAVVTTTADGISVQNATKVTFYLKGATNFNGDIDALDNYFTDESVADVDNRVKTEIEKAASKGFASIEADHVADFTGITRRMTFDLGLETPKVDTKTLIDSYYPNNTDGNSMENDHLFLEQLYFHYGRYLAISSNRKPIAAPNNLQGIWNDRGANSPWNSDIHTNINIQMNYWPTEITNLSDLHKPYVNFIIRGAQSEGWKQVGKKYNNGHGWSVLTESSLYNSMSTWGDNYLVANVWYTSHLWTHWRYTQDKEFLKQAFPVMWDCAKFWFHRLIEDRGFDNRKDEQANVRNYHTPYKYEPDGTFVAPNEFSAEQHDNQTEDGTAHAQQMIYYLFMNVKEAIGILGGAEAVGLTADDVKTLDLYLEKTDKGLHTEIYNGRWGETCNGVKKGEKLLREWKYTPFDISNDRGHRHMSHMMALFPLDQITPESEYFIPAVNSLKLRGDAATGWSMGWKVNLWARAQDGDHAHIIIKNALKHSTSYGINAGAGGIYYNLFDSHAPFQIDGNFGVCSGIAEMLMQSAHGYINILPALPKVWEAQGCVTGMKAMGNFTVDFNWVAGKCQKVTIVSHAGAELRVRCVRSEQDLKASKVRVDGKKVNVQVDEKGIATIPCSKGSTVVIDCTAK